MAPSIRFELGPIVGSKAFFRCDIAHSKTVSQRFPSSNVGSFVDIAQAPCDPAWAGHMGFHLKGTINWSLEIAPSRV